MECSRRTSSPTFRLQAEQRGDGQTSRTQHQPLLPRETAANWGTTCIRSPTPLSRNRAFIMTCSRRTALAAICLVAVFSSARSQVSVIGDLSQDKEARPGESYEGAILVKNDTDE